LSFGLLRFSFTNWRSSSSHCAPRRGHDRAVLV
jgi:hypothetical protein